MKKPWYFIQFFIISTIILLITLFCALEQMDPNTVPVPQFVGLLFISGAVMILGQHNSK